MFIEPLITQKNVGWIEVICGSMFSGKTEELIRRLNRGILAKKEIYIFKPKIDDRYDEKNIVSHNKKSINSIPIESPNEILQHIKDGGIIGIDEAQFFDNSLIDIVEYLANKGFRIIIAGLDMDYLGKPFGPMPQLLSIAEFVTKVNAICMNCGGVASHTYRLDSSEEQILIGSTSKYEARCRKCYSL